jgi:hypothetical protein
MASSSSGFSSSSSSSTPTVVRTPENDILDQVAQYAQSLASQMHDWASSTYSQTSAITNDAVNNFLATSQKMTGFAGGMADQYNNLFAPENAQLVADANSYASPSRMKADMAMAGATQAQAGDQAIKNSEQNLLGYGIDPSSGRYAALDKAAAVQNAANVAGAMNQQRMADINTGQQLRAEAVQAGSLLPAAISNAENTATQANAGASNAILANANTGANLQQLPNKYLQTAMSLKLSPVSNQTHSFGSSMNSSESDGGGGGGGGGYRGGGGYGGGGDLNSGGGTAWGMDHVNDYANGSMGDYSNYFAEGGYVDPEASPTGGAAIDDVRANLNAGEFVIPQDVASWKGQEFFHNLIAKSRALRNQSQMQSPVGPQAAPMQQAAPTQQAIPEV